MSYPDPPNEDIAPNAVRTVDQRPVHTARAVGVTRLNDGTHNRMLIDQYSAYQQTRGFSPRTVERRRSTLIRFDRHLHPKRIERAVTGDVEDFLRRFRAPRTRHAYRSDLRCFYRWAVARDLLDHDPTVLIDPVKVPRALPRPIGAEVHAALATATPRARRMIALGLYAGMRVSEIAALDGSDIDTRSTPPTLIIRGGKGGKDRIVPLHPALVDELAGLPRSGPLFPSPSRDGGVRPAAVSRTILRQFMACGIDATPHALRHTFGTEMARAARGNLLAVAVVMGHESMNTTMGYVGWSGESAGIIASMFGPEQAA